MTKFRSLSALAGIILGVATTNAAAQLPLPSTPVSNAYGWGDNSRGQLGNPTNSSTTRPNPNALRTGVVQNAVAIAAGQDFSLALVNDGTVWSWGNNRYGQLGNTTNNGSNSTNDTPVQISGLSNIVAVSGGVAHCMALKNDGTVWTWGNNRFGQLGNNTNTGSDTANPTPTQVAGISGVVAIAAGADHSIALKSDGTVWGWGYNRFGGLGNTTNINISNSINPTPLQAGITGVNSIAAGYYHTVVTKSDGSVWAFGWNIRGQMGNPSTAGANGANATPYQVSISGVSKVAAGYYHSYALKSDGTVWSWGLNSYGQLGNSTNSGVDASNTTPVSAGLSGVIGIASGYFHGLALKSDGRVWGWGRNEYGQLGNSTNNNNVSAPNPTVTQINSLRNVTAIAAGQLHSLALANGAPVAQDDSAILGNNSASRVFKLRGTDPQSDALTYSIVSDPSYGTLSNLNGDYITYTPNVNFTTSDSFTFKANDGTFDSLPATFSLTMNNAPELVSLVPETADGAVTGSGSSVAANVPLKLSLTVKDSDGADHIRMIYLVFNKTLSNNNGGSLDYNPANNQISLRNAAGQIVAGQVVGTAGTYNNGFVTLDFGASSVVKNTKDKTITVTWAVTPAPNFTGLKGLWAQTRDIYNASAGFTELANWTVLPETTYVSRMEAWDGLTIVKPGFTSQSLILPVSNPDNVALTYSIVDPPTNGTLGPIIGNRVVYTPGPGFDAAKQDSFTFKVNDGVADSNTATYTVKYNGAPQLGALVVEKVTDPIADPSSAVGEALKLSLTVSDEDGVGNIRMIYLLFNKAQSHNNGASLEYDPGTNRIALRNAQGQLVTGQIAGTVGTQSNGLVTLDFEASSVEKDPANKTITVTWVVTPEAGFTGLKGLWAQVRDISGLTAGFSKLGEWTVVPAPVSLKTKSSAPSTKTY